jgi:hypothetical protein
MGNICFVHQKICLDYLPQEFSDLLAQECSTTKVRHYQVRLKKVDCFYPTIFDPIAKKLPAVLAKYTARGFD